MAEISTIVWTVLGVVLAVGVAVLSYQIFRTAIEAEGFLRELRENVTPILRASRATASNVEEIVEKGKETFEVYNKGILRPAVWAASAAATAKGMANKFRGKEEE